MGFEMEAAEQRNLEAIEQRGWTAQPPRSLVRYVNGECFDLALALHSFLPSAEFVALGSADSPDHVALRLPDGRLVDVRGVTDDIVAFGRGFSNMHINPDSIVTVGRDVPEFYTGQAGREPPYEGSHEIADARKALRKNFPGLQAIRMPRVDPVGPRM